MASGTKPLINADCLSWPPLRASYPSAWHGHVKFAHWITATAKPKTIVELGTHNGVSFSAFCNAVSRLNLNTQCYAVDTWQGDAHAGHYGTEVFDDLTWFITSNFAANATLLKMTFDEALPQFNDQSIDLMHIDGYHTYDAVKNDFASWLPKMSKTGIVLFHDTQVKDRNFGVWKLWQELSQKYPTFEFKHCHGLGVLALTPAAKDIAPDLFNATDSEATKIREAFAD